MLLLEIAAWPRVDVAAGPMAASCLGLVRTLSAKTGLLRKLAFEEVQKSDAANALLRATSCRPRVVRCCHASVSLCLKMSPSAAQTPSRA